MSREKQIEEMAKTLCEDCAKSDPCSLAAVEGMCNSVRKQATAMHNAGYRKQEWISVEERLPESQVMVLCYTPCDGYIFVGYYQKVDPNPYWKSYWNIITAMRSTKKMTKKVTHWMPLPEPPKGE